MCTPLTYSMSLILSACPCMHCKCTQNSVCVCLYNKCLSPIHTHTHTHTYTASSILGDIHRASGHRAPRIFVLLLLLLHLLLLPRGERGGGQVETVEMHMWRISPDYYSALSVSCRLFSTLTIIYTIYIYSI